MREAEEGSSHRHLGNPTISILRDDPEFTHEHRTQSLGNALNIS